MKKNISFYPHYVNMHNSWQFKLLRSLLGWEAEGKYWALCNMIGDSEDCILKLPKKQIRANAMDDLSLSSLEFERFINILTHECELLVNLDGNITTENIRDTLRLVLKDREESRKRYQKEKEIKQTKIFSI